MDATVDEVSPGPVEDAVVVLLTAEQAAQRLQLRASWLRRKAAARAIPCRYVGKHLRFTHDDLVAIADQSKSDPKTTRIARGRVT
ncbi:helix-turn-helix domain-containing protein [Actinokineospora sp. HUAS TT18]|uniref:helix-turn-helix domain-containing protein n=1 Tax=Actinokineospora sp. HUAS TT18 TaxID=3447451 RepID=UPI003F526FCD